MTLIQYKIILSNCPDFSIGIDIGILFQLTNTWQSLENLFAHAQNPGEAKTWCNIFNYLLLIIVATEKVVTFCFTPSIYSVFLYIILTLNTLVTCMWTDHFIRSITPFLFYFSGTTRTARLYWFCWWGGTKGKGMLAKTVRNQELWSLLAIFYMLLP